MNIKLKNLVHILVTILLFSSLAYAAPAPEFKDTGGKIEWIKKLLGSKKFIFEYPDNATKKEKTFYKQFLTDFIKQKGIEHIEAIAVGRSVNDPNIAKFNKACPDKKPIDIRRYWAISGEEPYVPNEEELENNIDIPMMHQRRCADDFKIYKYDLFNRKDGRDEYVRYCGDVKYEIMFGEPYTDKQTDVIAEYVHFDPNKCKYTKSTFTKLHPNMDDYLTGVIKYKDKYYFYSIETGINYRNKQMTTVRMKFESDLDEIKYYSYNTGE